jgi:hypothetical protein
MNHFKIRKSPYKSPVLKAGKYVDQTIYTQYDVYDEKNGTIFFRFRELHKSYLTDKEIQCTPEWEPYKELLSILFITLDENQSYNYRTIMGPIREIKLNQILC